MAISDRNTPRLPVIKTMHEAFRFVGAHLGRLAMALVIPTAVIVGAELGAELAFTNGYIAGHILLRLIAGVAYVLFAVTCHRAAILGMDQVPRFGVLVPSAREVRFAGWAIAAYMLAYLIAIPFTMILMSLMFGVFADPDPAAPGLFVLILIPIMIPSLYVISRWLPVFPATAVDRREDLIWAWNLTAGNGLRILAVCFLLPLFWQIPIALMPSGTWGLYAGYLLASCALLAVEVAALSRSYQWLHRHVEPSLAYDGPVKEPDVPSEG